MVLLDLPDDVLLNILDLLDPRSIVLLRRVCRPCNFITRELSTWMNVLRHQDNMHRGPKGRLEQPISSYSAADVEAMVMRTARLETEWSSETPLKHARFNSFALEPGQRAVAELVEGGRWFILGSLDGSGRVWYHDLDANEIKPRVLLQWQGSGQWEPESMTLNVDADTERLSLLIAIGFTNDSDDDLISIYKVMSSDYEDGLESCLLHSFQAVGRGVPLRSNSLCENLLLRETPIGNALEIFDWPYCASDTHLKTRIIAGPKYRLDRCRVFLLPNRHLVIMNRKHMAIFKVSDPEACASTKSPTDRGISVPLWKSAYPKRGSTDHGVEISPFLFDREDSLTIGVQFFFHATQIIYHCRIRFGPNFDVQMTPCYANFSTVPIRR